MTKQNSKSKSTPVPQSNFTNILNTKLPCFMLLVLFFLISFRLTLHTLILFQDLIHSSLGRFLYTLTFYSLGLLTSVSFYMILYKVDNRLVRKFRWKNIPWPWHENPAHWEKLYRRGLKLNVQIDLQAQYTRESYIYIY